MSSICGVNCDECKIKDKCKCCIETNGHPWGENCALAEFCYDKKENTKERIIAYKNELIEEINNLNLDFILKIEELYPLNGIFVNIEYELHNGEKIRLLKDNNIYLWTQLPKADNSGYYGIIADNDYILVGKYDNNYQNANIIYTCFSTDFLIEEADECRKDCWKMIKERQDCTFLFLTKRIDRFNNSIPEEWNDGYDNVVVCCTIENQKNADYKLSIFKELQIKHKCITA